VSDAVARAGETFELAERHLDASLVEVLRILGFDKQYQSARGSYLYDAAGVAHLDFHTGEGFASLGHNNPDVRDVLRAVLFADLADGVQLNHSVLAGMLAEALSERLPPGLGATYFTSTGAEAVDSAMKFARAATGRPRLLSCDSSFHGVTLGPLSLVGDEFFKEGFGPLVPGCQRVPFGDLSRLEAELRSKDVAAFTESGDVRSPLISSTSFIVGTGLKKCSPNTFSGRLVAEAILLILMEDVFEASIVFLGQTLSRVEKTCSFIRGSSNTASTTRSALWHAFAKSMLPLTLAWICDACSLLMCPRPRFL